MKLLSPRESGGGSLSQVSLVAKVTVTLWPLLGPSSSLAHAPGGRDTAALLAVGSATILGCARGDK